MRKAEHVLWFTAAGVVLLWPPAWPVALGFGALALAVRGAGAILGGRR